MKRYLLILIAFVGFGISVNAGPTCKIKGTPNGTIEASIESIDSEAGKVTIYFTNDSDVAANVRFTVGCYGSGSTIVQPRSSATRTVTISKGCAPQESSLNLSGEKCN